MHNNTIDLTTIEWKTHRSDMSRFEILFAVVYFLIVFFFCFDPYIYPGAYLPHIGAWEPRVRREGVQGPGGEDF